MNLPSTRSAICSWSSYFEKRNSFQPVDCQITHSRGLLQTLQNPLTPTNREPPNSRTFNSLFQDCGDRACHRTAENSTSETGQPEDPCNRATSAAPRPNTAPDVTSWPPINTTTQNQAGLRFSVLWLVQRNGGSPGRSWGNGIIVVCVVVAAGGVEHATVGYSVLLLVQTWMGSRAWKKPEPSPGRSSCTP